MEKPNGFSPVKWLHGALKARVEVTGMKCAFNLDVARSFCSHQNFVQ